MSADFTQDAFASAYLLRQTSPRPLESANIELQNLSDEDLIALVKRMIVTLEARGFIARTPGQARSIHLLISCEELPDLI